MKEILFNVPNEVANDEVIEKMTYYYDKSNEISKIFENDRLTGKELARELREELKKEYKNNDTIRTSKFYKEHSLFSVYKDAVRDSYVKTTGRLDNGQKTRGFLFDVRSYMTYYDHFLM
ncbi:TPA: hypothetical protein ACSP9O_001095 [Staphylococcus aureus]|uniref:hypothetical protein n=1 Tax=Mammaliicoccus sciuri TaxID=1296 RepID=UPI002975C596|nr:hypothetical protein [Mammaliicoccus sciuri]MDW4480965.1 hypothetical protein [Staphylococcus saprophyticus]MEB6288267.1 hypothetical protein [Mammaliicoccus sciuri]